MAAFSPSRAPLCHHFQRHPRTQAVAQHPQAALSWQPPEHSSPATNANSTRPERRGSAPAPQELQAGGTGGADQPQKPSRAGTQPTPRATPTPLFSRNNLPTPDADAARSEPQRTWLARHLVHPPAGASENTGRFQRCPSPRTPPHGRGGTCDRSRHTPLSARKSHPPQARPPNSGRPPRLRYPPRTHSPGGRPPQEKHRPTRRSRHAQRLASMPFGGGGDSRRRNLPRRRDVLAILQPAF